MPAISVDGTDYDVDTGRTLLQALDELGVLMNGVEIPHFCWHPKLSVDGSCRLCQVEIEGMPKLQIACDTVVAEGMVVHTESERVRRAREGVMELLLVNHPLDCPICDQAGECKLQDYAVEYGVRHARSEEPRRAAKKRVELGPTVLLDQERCILCRRCVRFCREIPETGELAVLGRGDRSVIEASPGAELANPYSMNVADICPVGALTTRDFRFKVRVWDLEERPGLCTGCAQGCNVSIGVAHDRAYRYVPRRNDAVNDTWICDEGRLSYARIHGADRVEGAQVRREDGVLAEAGVDEAIAEAARRLGTLRTREEPARIGLWVSPHSTNEALFVARCLADALGGAPAGFAVARGREDALLLRAEKAANATGARALGFEEVDALTRHLRDGSLEGLIMVGHDALTSGALEDTAILRGIDTLVLLDTHHSAIERVASVILPVRHTAEKRGTLTNHAGRVQRVEPALTPAFDARDEGALLWTIAQALSLEGFSGVYDVGAISRAMCEEVAVFSGLDFDSVGDTGGALHLQLAGGER